MTRFAVNIIDFLNAHLQVRGKDTALEFVGLGAFKIKALFISH